tara:strand:+ start:4630 stop:4884 length:255 start_codon:yes stop_codon:yes gene_type:complete
MQFRLHIDVPLGVNEEEAMQKAQYFMKFVFSDDDQLERMREHFKLSQLNYRLGHDEDRQKSNYLKKTENGHVTNKKIRIDFSSD